MRTVIWTVGTVGTAYLIWRLLRKMGDTPLEAGAGLARIATSPAPLLRLAGEVGHAFAHSHNNTETPALEGTLS